MVQCHYCPLKLHLDPIFLSRESLFQGTISYAKHRRNNINGWHRIFWPNRSSTTRSHTCQHHAEITQSHTFNFCSYAARFSFTEMRVSNEERDEPDVDDFIECLDLRDDFDFMLTLY